MENIRVWFRGNLQSLVKLKDGVTPEDKIAAAYLKYEERLFEYMDYAFAIVIHIVNQNKWILGRDRFGIEPLYFRISDNSTIKYSQFLPELRQGKDSLNYKRISEYLDFNTTSYQRYHTDTFYVNILSVLPAHYMTFQNRQLSSHPYWKPKLTDFNTLQKTNFFDEFRTLLVDSIEKSTAGYQSVGAHLSGGMDSTSLAILYAQKKPLHTFFTDASLSSGRDRYFADLVAGGSTSIQHHIVQPNSNIYESLFKLSHFSGLPEQFILPKSFHIPVSVMAQKLGCQAILTGHDGDTVIGHGRNHVTNLFENREWQELKLALETLATGLEQADGNYDNLSEKQKKIHYKNHYFNPKIVSYLKQRDLKQALHIMRRARKEVGYVPMSIINYLTTALLQRLKHSFSSKNNLHKLLKQDFEIILPPISLTSDSLYDLPAFDTFEQFAGVTNREFVYSNEEYFALGQMYGHRYLFPFFDTKLFELSLSVPDAVKFGNGYTRALLRKGLKNDLPKELLERKGKTEFSDYLFRATESLWNDKKDRFMENNALWQIVEKNIFLKNLEIFVNHKTTPSQKRAATRRLSKVMFFGIWLDTLNT